MTGVEKALPVIASVAIIVLVAIVQERSRDLAAIVATLPLTAPLAAWIVFSASGGDHQHTAHFVRSMLAASIANVLFVIVCWYGFQQRWPFVVVMVVAFAVWGILVAVPYLARRIL
jgi:uncharacterized membrane protein (GlpM family)